MDTVPIIPHVLTWLQTISASVLRVLLVSYLKHHMMKRRLMSVAAHSSIAVWLQLIRYTYIFLFVENFQRGYMGWQNVSKVLLILHIQYYWLRWTECWSVPYKHMFISIFSSLSCFTLFAPSSYTVVSLASFPKPHTWQLVTLMFVTQCSQTHFSSRISRCVTIFVMCCCFFF